MQRPDEKDAKKNASASKATRSEINAAIKGGAPAPVYVLFGEEDFLRRSYKNSFIKTIVGEDTMNLTVFSGENVSIPEIIGTAETMPFFAERRLIVIEESGLFKKECDDFVEYLGHLPESTCIVFSEESVDKRLKLYKKVSAIGGVIAEMKYQSPDELVSWIAAKLSHDGYKITKTAAEEIMARIGVDMNTLAKELDKLESYAGARTEITIEDVDAICGKRIDDRIFDMIEAAGSGRQKQALSLYADLLALREAPIKILVLMTRHIFQLVSVRELDEQGIPSGQIARSVGINFYFDKVLTQARRLSLDKLRKSAEMAVELDAKIKVGDIQDQLAVELLLISLSK